MADTDYSATAARTLQVSGRAAELLGEWLDCAADCAASGDLVNGDWVELAQRELRDGRLTGYQPLLDWIQQMRSDALETAADWHDETESENKVREVAKAEVGAAIADVLLGAFGLRGGGGLMATETGTPATATPREVLMLGEIAAKRAEINAVCDGFADGRVADVEGEVIDLLHQTLRAIEAGRVDPVAAAKGALGHGELR